MSEYRKILSEFDSYEEYLDNVNSSIDTNWWNEAKKNHSRSSYEHYLRFYPQGKYKDEAERIINEFIKNNIINKDKNAWEKAKEKNTIKSYKKYIFDYHITFYENSTHLNNRYDGVYIDEAEKRIDKLRNEKIANDKKTWEVCLTSNTRKDYENYLKFYPDGMYAGKAFQKLLEIEEGFWELTCQKGTRKDYENYLKFYPAGIYIRNAKKEIETLIELELELLKLKLNPIIEWAIQNDIDDYCIPRKFEELENLKVLKLSGIKTFPKCLLKLEKLEKLDLSYSKLEELPYYISEFKFLIELNLSYNNFKSSLELIGNFTNLKRLKLSLYMSHKSDLIVDKLPESIGKLVNLEELDVSHSRLSKLPNSFEKLTNLKILNMHDTYAAIPAYIGKFENLVTFHFSIISNRRYKIPSSIKNLKKLDEHSKKLLEELKLHQDKDEKAYLKAKKIHSKNSYNEYLKYDNSFYLHEEEAKEERDWLRVLEKDENDKSDFYYRDYLTNYPHGKYADKAKEHIDKLAWDRVLCHKSFSINFLDACRSYTITQPNGKHIKKAKEIIKEYDAWLKGSVNNNLNGYKEYLIKYPNGRYKDSAINEIRKLSNPVNKLIKKFF